MLVQSPEEAKVVTALPGADWPLKRTGEEVFLIPHLFSGVVEPYRLAVAIEHFDKHV